MMETIAETVVAATEAVTAATEVFAENVAIVSLSGDQFSLILEYLNYLTAFGLFFVVCVLCYFGYKFFRIFF